MNNKNSENMVGDKMYKLLVFRNKKVKEYALVKTIKILEHKIYEENLEVFIKKGENVEQIIPYKHYNLEEQTTCIVVKEDVKSFERQEKIWIGDKDCHVVLNEKPYRIYIEGNICYLENDSDTPCYLNGHLLERERFELQEGDMIFIDNIKFIFFQDTIEIEGDKEFYTTSLIQKQSKDYYFAGFPSYRRSPRVIKVIKSEKVDIMQPPAKANMQKGSLMQMIIPPLTMTAVTVGTSIVMKRGNFIFATIAMTAVTLIFSVVKFFKEQRENKKKNKKRIQVYRNYLLNIRKKLKLLRQGEKETLSYQYPTLKEIESMIQQYSTRIYERTALDDDFLTINLGMTKGISSIKVDYKKQEMETEEEELASEGKQVYDDFNQTSTLPVIVDLKKAHLGLVGGKAHIHEQLKIILSQITFFQSYHDVEVIFIHNQEYSDEFKYMRWYPHMRIHAINAFGRIYNDRTRDQILGSVLQILKDRKAKLEENKQETKFLPHFVFIIDDPKIIVNHAVMEYFQGKTEDLAMSIIYTTDQKGNLPEYMHTIAIYENSQKGILLLNEGKMVDTKFVLPHIENVDLECMARDLAVLKHEKGMVSQIPESINFFEMFGVRNPEDFDAPKRWRENESHKSLGVPLGVRAKDDYVELNLHEKAHGPHGLVAGTTGSGKSEIVQSYILSLAVNFHPYEVGFLLIDYKGGGMAGLFQNLPHLLGTITNLDGSESIRAMISIKSELARRQKIFSDNNVNHINGYSKLFKLGKVEEPLPHLFLISDEFAELKKEQPDFMKELVSAARIGRSLGIHLILATQKPSGVVDDQIWTNSKFKLCLKVQNEADSKEMLKTPDAANITQAGRSYLQVGNNEIYELFQSAWSGATYQEEEKEEVVDDRVYLVNAIGQGEVVNGDLSGGEESNKIKATQLDVTVDYLQNVFEDMKAPKVRKPWLPSLPLRIKSPYMDEIIDVSTRKEHDITVSLGLVDIPEEQKQMDYKYDFISQGHLLYVASSGFGKSVFLGTVISGLAVKNSVKNLNIFIMDMGNNALIPFQALPQVADYITMDDDEKIQKFVTLMEQEIKTRKQQLAKAMVQNFDVYNQSMKEKLKAIIICVDNFDVIKEFGYGMEEFYQKLSRDGASLGIYMVITATRANAVKTSTLNNFKSKIGGFNFEENEVRALVGRSDYKLPELKGRAMVKFENVNVMQLYTPVMFESDIEYSEKIKELVSKIADMCKEERAVGVPVLPEIVEYSELSKYPKYKKDASKAPIGIDADSLEVQYIDLSEPLQVIVGGNQTGKTNALKLIIEAMRENTIYLSDSSDMELYSYNDYENVNYIEDNEKMQKFIEEIRVLTEERENAFLAEKQNNPTLLARLYYSALPPIYVVADLLQEFIEKIDKTGSGAHDILLKSMTVGVHFVITTEGKIRARGKLADLIKEAKMGLVLGDMKEQTVFGYLRVKEDNRQVDIGYLMNKGESIKIKIPKYRKM